MSKVYITTPIYYVNDKPHIGHTYTTIAADILARYHRLKGDETFFLTGTDEHGAKIEEKAKAAGIDVQKFVDDNSARFRSAWLDFGILYDSYIRTTDEKHIKAVQAALQKMYDKGDIYNGKYEGLYCRGCEQYISEKDLVDGKCPDHNTVPEKMSEDCYMFRLSKYANELLTNIRDNVLKIEPKERKNEIISLIEKQGLKDVSFSRQNVKWGIPLPWDEKQTAYVWADAFLNYLTGLGWDGTDEAPDMWPPDIQIMSKDILRVHTTIWPAMLLSLGLPLPKRLFIHGFFLVDGQKMSKSIGNVVAPEELVAKYGVDASRYLIISSTVFGQDGDISWEKFDAKFNSDLANGLGNLVARVSNLLEKNEIEVDVKMNSDELLIADHSQAIEGLKLDHALEVLWSVLRNNDEYLTQKQPWKMTDKEEIREVLQNAAQDILNVGVLLEPFMPETSKKIVEQFRETQIKKGGSLFPRI